MLVPVSLTIWKSHLTFLTLTSWHVTLSLHWFNKLLCLPFSQPALVSLWLVCTTNLLPVCTLKLLTVLTEHWHCNHAL